MPNPTDSDEWQEESTVPPDPDGAERPGDATIDFQPSDGSTENADAPAIPMSGSSLGPDSFRSLDFIGDYKILDHIAHGGMGVVFRARHKRLNRTVALKMIRSGQFASRQDRARFNLEAEAAAKLDHPGITPIYEIGEHDGQPFFAMKYVEGGSLEDRLQEFVDDPRKAARLVADVAHAVHHAHQRGTLHRDLKPNNILIDDNDNPLVTDFGLAKISDHESGVTQTGAVMGTPGYMSPEQAASSKSVTAAADIYSLGAILFATLTGRPPFEAESPVEAILQVVNKDAPKPSSLVSTVPLELELICLKCLSRDPDDRYTSAAELAKDLERWLLGDPVSVRPPSMSGMAWKWFQENIAKAIKMSVLGSAMALAMGVIIIDGTYAEHFWIHESLPSEQQPLATRLLSGQLTAWGTQLPKPVWMTICGIAILFVPLAPCLLGALTIWSTKPKSWAETTTFGLFAALAFAFTLFLICGWMPFSEEISDNVAPDLALIARQNEPMARAQLDWKYPDLSDHAVPFSVLQKKVSQEISLNSATELPRVGLLFFSTMLLVIVMTSAAYRITDYPSRIKRVFRFLEICLPSVLLFIYFMMVFSESIYGRISSHSTHDWIFLSLWIIVATFWFFAAYQGWRWFKRILLPVALIGLVFLSGKTDPDDRFKKAFDSVSARDFTAAAKDFDKRVASQDVPYIYDVAFAMGLHARAGDLPGYFATARSLSKSLKEIAPRKAVDALEISLLVPNSEVNGDLTERLAVFADEYPPNRSDGLGSPEFVQALYTFRSGDGEGALELLKKAKLTQMFDVEKSLALQSIIHHQMGDTRKAFRRFHELDAAMQSAEKKLEGQDKQDDESTYRRWNHAFSLLSVYYDQAESLLRGGVSSDEWRRVFLHREITKLDGAADDPATKLALAQVKLMQTEIARTNKNEADEENEPNYAEDEEINQQLNELSAVVELAIESFEDQPSKEAIEVISSAVSRYYAQRTLEDDPPEQVSDWLERLESIAESCEPKKFRLVVYDVMRRLGSVANQSGRHDLAAKWNARYAEYLRKLPEDIDTGSRASRTWWMSRGQDIATDNNDSVGYLLRQALMWQAQEHAAAGDAQAATDVFAAIWNEFPEKLPVNGKYIQHLAKQDSDSARQFIDGLKTTDPKSWRRNRFLQRTFLRETQPQLDRIAGPWKELAAEHLRDNGFDEQRIGLATDSQYWRSLTQSISKNAQQAFESHVLALERPPESRFTVKGVGAYEFGSPLAVTKGTCVSSTASSGRIYQIASIQSKSDQTCQMVVGYNSSLKVWLNGEVAFDAKERAYFHPRADQVDVSLRSGCNELFLRMDKSGRFQVEFETSEGWPADITWIGEKQER